MIPWLLDSSTSTFLPPSGFCGPRWPLLSQMNLSLRPLGGSLSPEENTTYIPLIEDNHVPGIVAAVEVEIEEEYPETATSTVETEDGVNHVDDFICPGEGLIRSPTDCSVFYNCPTDGLVSPRTVTVSSTTICTGHQVHLSRRTLLRPLHLRL